MREELRIDFELFLGSPARGTTVTGDLDLEIEGFCLRAFALTEGRWTDVSSTKFCERTDFLVEGQALGCFLEPCFEKLMIKYS